YATDFLLKAGFEVDVYERLPAPFGLVRYGVAPDHQTIKRVAAAFERTAKQPGFRFRGNVEIGRDLALEELRRAYHAVVLAYGAATDRRLGVPGEELGGSHAATEFVAWYNSHPDHEQDQYDLGHGRAVIVGLGNVALDVARVLVRKPEELAVTDIADTALAALRASRVREVVLLGRRGPAEAAFDQGELADIVALSGVEVTVEGDVSFAVPEDAEAAQRKNAEYLATLPRAPSGKADRVVRLRFLASPVELVGEHGRVTAIRFEDNELVERDGRVSARGTGRVHELATGFVVRSIGYQGMPLPGTPFDPKRAVVPSRAGRVLATDGTPMPGLYVTGWIKRGPSGLIGTNKACAKETIDEVLADLEALPAPSFEPAELERLLAEREVRVVDYDAWHRVDAAETERGKPKGKIRDKFTSVADLLKSSGV
ncbi:MAG TPA: NADP oxidoreductase, partial [Polyangiaceae bacterium]|nr:NADP oxidoreductase [Polyangiaceae bacterium]